MFIFITILAALGMLSLLVFIAAIIGRVLALVSIRRRADAADTGREWRLNTALVRRSLVMAVIWIACAVSLHLLMVDNPTFVDQIPSGLLRSDVRGSIYAAQALTSLTRRAVDLRVAEGEAQRITDDLLASHWWVKATRLRAFDDDRPVQIWLKLNIERGWLTETELRRWLDIVPPPIFMVNADRRGLDSDLIVIIQFGRDWQRQTEAPYRVNAIRVSQVAIDGKPSAFKMVEQPGSHAAIGWYASVVSYSLEGLKAPTNPRGGHCEVVITYALDVEPNGYQNIGPLTFRQNLVLNREGP